MWLPTLALSILWLAFVNCSPTVLRQTEKTLVTGVQQKTSDGSVPVRLEINELIAHHPDQWNLYVLGLRALQQTDQNSPTSYYQIAGIHGRPFKVWEGAEGVPGKSGGYCTHINALFPSWHRPYLALFEQELYKHVNAIAQTFAPEVRARYVQAANAFRIPYWDWALGEGKVELPWVFTIPTQQVWSPDQKIVTIPNPLLRYDFHPLVAGDFEGQYSTYNMTLRWPTTGPSPMSQEDSFIGDLKSKLTYLHDTVSQGFVSAGSFNDFSLTYVENAHGSVHYIVGAESSAPAQGHMTPVEYSAFDPVFMLHHCNVDRLYAIWQAAHPDRYLERTNIGQNGNFWLEDNVEIDGDTPLKPFWNSQSTFWTSNQVRDTRTFGYVYPETVNTANINATIAQLYSSTARGKLGAAVRAGGNSPLTQVVSNGTYTDWSIEVQVSSQAIHGPFSVVFSLSGGASSNSVVGVGAWHVLISAMHHAKKSKKHEHPWKRDSVQKRSGVVSLTTSLLDVVTAGQIKSLDAKDVEPYLKQALVWTVVTGAGKPVPNGDLQDLNVMALSRQVRIPDDPNQPLEYSGEVRQYPDITAGKSATSEA